MKIRVYASTNIVGSEVDTEIEIDDEDLEGMDEDKRTKYIEQIAQEFMWDLIEWGWDKIDD